MKKSLWLTCFLCLSLCVFGQEVVFELEVGTEGKGLDAFIINDAMVFEVEVFDPPPGFSTLGLEMGDATNGIWLDDFRGTDYQIDIVWLDVGQWADETSGDDADGVLTIRGQTTDTHIRGGGNAGYNVEREKDASGYGQGGLKIVSFFGDGSDNTEQDRRRVNDGTVPEWQGQSFRAHSSQISLVAWEPPEDGNVPPAMEIDFNTPNSVVFWDETFPDGHAGISWASGLAQVVYFRVTDLSDVPAPTPPPPPDDFIIEAESGETYDFNGETSQIIGTGTDVKTEGEPEAMIFPGESDPANDGVENFTYNGGMLPEDFIGASDWAAFSIEATADQAGLYDVYYRGRNVGVDDAFIVLRSNPDDPTVDPFTGADGITFFEMATHVMRRTTHTAGVINIQEGENILTVSAWGEEAGDVGFLLDQILLERNTSNVAFLTDSIEPNASDPDLVYRLENTFGFDVTVMDLEVVADSDPPRRTTFTPEVLESGQFDLLVVSAVNSSGNISDQFLGVDIPILMLEQAVADSMQYGVDGTNTGNLREWVVTDNTHPITDGFSLGNIQVQDWEKPELPGTGLAYITEPIAEGAQVLATTPDDEAQITALAIDAGATLLDGSSAANRRVFLGYADWNFGLNVMTDESWQLVDSAIQWLTGEVDVQHWSIY